MKPHQNYISGILLSVAGYTAWVVADTFGKLASDTLSTPAIMLVGTVACLVYLCGLITLRRGWHSVRTQRPWFHLMRSVLILVAGLASLVGVIHLSLADFYTIIFTNPLILAVLGHFLLREYVGKSSWVAIVAGFAGVLIAVRFGQVDDHALSLIGVVATCVASLTLALTMLSVRWAEGEHNYALTFWPEVLGVAVFLAYLLIQNTPALDPKGAVFAAIGGAMSGLGALLTNASLKLAPVDVVSPYHYTQIIGGACVGYIIWGHVPSWPVMVGAVIITLSGLYLLRAHTKERTQDV